MAQEMKVTVTEKMLAKVNQYMAENVNNKSDYALRRLRRIFRDGMAVEGTALVFMSFKDLTLYTKLFGNPQVTFSEEEIHLN